MEQKKPLKGCPETRFERQETTPTVRRKLHFASEELCAEPGILEEEQLADSSSVGKDYAQWERGNIRGLAGRRHFVRIEKDAGGREIRVYDVTDDDEWGNTTPEAIGAARTAWRRCTRFVPSGRAEAS